MVEEEGEASLVTLRFPPACHRAPFPWEFVEPCSNVQVTTFTPHVLYEYLIFIMALSRYLFFNARPLLPFNVPKASNACVRRATVEQRRSKLQQVFLRNISSGA